MDKRFDIVKNEKGEKVLISSSISEGTVEVPEGVIHIGDKVFEWCVKITKIMLPQGLKTIGQGAFTGCSLEEVMLPEGLEVIGDSAFFGCGELKSVEMPKSLKQIESCAFYGCQKLERVQLPEGLEKLGRDAFRNCSKLLHLELPEHLKKQKKSRKAKPEMVELAKDEAYFTLADDGRKVIGIKNSKAKYDVICIPERVKIVSGGAFYGVKVKTVILPDDVETIETNAFKNCKNLQAIYLPSSVKIIGKDAFAGCKKLEIYCESEPQEGWINLPDEEKTYYDDMTDAFNFHRSAGSFDDHYVVERTEIIRNTYNPEKCSIHTNITREEFYTRFVK